MSDTIESIGYLVLVVLGIAGLIFLAAIGGALIGALAGWLVGFTPLGVWIIETFEAFGITGINMIHIGTTAGFISGFVRASSSSRSKDD